jgi:hypothetical protein
MRRAATFYAFSRHIDVRDCPLGGESEKLAKLLLMSCVIQLRQFLTFEEALALISVNFSRISRRTLVGGMLPGDFLLLSADNYIHLSEVKFI